MVDVAVLPAFAALMMVLLIAPGPNMVFMVAVGLESGPEGAAKAILGIATGLSAYTVGVVAGMGRIAESHPPLFEMVKLLGAGYLVWLAIGTVRSARRRVNAEKPGGAAHLYVRGLMISLTNPKIILFYVAVLPQFMGDAQSAVLQLAMLGAVNVMMEVLLYGAIGVLAGVLSTRSLLSGKSSVLLSYIAAAVYLVLAGVAVADVLGGVMSR